jgi:hemolysin activation/secretion protein
LAGSIELRTNVFVDKWLPQGSSVYTFYDAGVIWNNKNLPGQPIRSSATSLGAGARLIFSKNMAGNLLIAKPMTKKVSAFQAAGKNSTAPRVFFGITATI